MGYKNRLLADSISPQGHRMTSFEVTMPRIVLAELNTHRDKSRNSASSRAIPAEKMLARVKEDPFLPIYWGKNQKGMQAEQELTAQEQDLARAFWLDGRDHAVSIVERMIANGVHKQITNRLLEPFLWHTVILTATEWENSYNLRRDRAAQPEIRRAFDMMFDSMEASSPKEIDYGEWHLPLVEGIDHVDLVMERYTKLEIAKICCGRCGRVSYLTHDGKREPKADISIVDDKFVPFGHMSPLEHAARPMTDHEYELFTQKPYKVVNHDGNLSLAYDPEGTPRHFCGNVEGWIQYRKLIPGEGVFRQMNR